MDSLRRQYNDPSIDLRKWISTPGNLYTGRAGRIFIRGEIYHYPKSKWGNPYKGDNTLRDYVEHLFTSGLIRDIEELKGLKLGCFCSSSQQSQTKCHAAVLAKLVNTEVDNIKQWLQTQDPQIKTQIITNLGI